MDYASTRAMRLKVFRAQVAMTLNALENEAARNPCRADTPINFAVDHLKQSLVHLDNDLTNQISRSEPRP